MIRKLLFAILLSMGISPALAASASFQGTLGSGAAFAAWCVGGTGASCTGGVFWPSTVISNSSGTELFTSGNAAYVQFPSGATLTAKIGDGTNGPAAVKPASTATAATDQSFATNESPNSQLSVAAGTSADSPAAVPASTTPASQVALLKAITNLLNSATQACAAAPCITTIGNVGVDPSSGVSAPALAFLALPATTTTQIIALSGTKVTYVTFAKVWAPGAVNVTFKYGTGTNCGTGTTTLEGPYTMSASNIGWTEGNGSGSVIIVPAGQALCITTDATVTNGGVKLIYEQK